MRCNRPKPIFGIFHLLCGVLIVSVVLGINAISSVEAVTEIGPGDRIFFLGDQWATNRTASQTGFEVIRISSHKPASLMSYWYFRYLRTRQILSIQKQLSPMLYLKVNRSNL